MTIRWTAPVLLAAAQDGQPRRWTARAYNGGPMRVDSPKLDAPLVVDLAGVKFSPSLVANLFHDSERIVGHVTDKSIAAGALELSGVVSFESPDAEQFLKAAENGFPWQASIEADQLRIEKLAAGKSAQINGRTVTGPVYVAKRSNVYGVAFLGRGADEGTTVTLAAGAAVLFEENTMLFAQWLTALGFEDETKLTDSQKAALQAKYDKEVADLKAGHGDPDPDPTPPPPAFDLDALKAAYASHEAVIETKAFEYAGKVKADKLATLKAGALQAAVALKSKALQQEWAPQRFEVEAMKAAMEYERELFRAEAPTGPAIHAGAGNLTGDVLQAAMAQRLRIPDHEKDYEPKVLQAAHDAFRGRVGLQQLLLLAAQQNGYNCGPWQRVDDGNLRDVIEYAFPPRILRAGGASVFSLPGIFSNVANKELLQGFMEEDQTWREIAQVKTVTDFKAVTAYRMLDNMEYEELAPDGTMRHGQVGEESYTRQARTYAKMFSLTRNDIINDDLGAFDDLRNRLGRGAARKFNKVFWAEFINNSTFFTAARGNAITGATTNLGTDYVGLALGLTAFDNLKSTAVAPATVGERIGGTPSILLVPPELEANALRIYSPVLAATAATVNLYANKYRPVKVHQLSDSSYTGYSATAWYLLRNPAILAAIVVSFLNGSQSPTVESADASFDRLGVDFRGYHDFGCDQAEWLCGIRARGT